MRWKAKYTTTDYKEGATRLKRAFAYMPLYITGEIVWLEMYDVLQVYTITKQKAIIDGQEQLFSIGKWINLSKRLCK